MFQPGLAERGDVAQLRVADGAVDGEQYAQSGGGRKTGCAGCVVWDELVDDILREAGGVYLDRQGPQMLRLTQAPSPPHTHFLSLFPFHHLKALGPTFPPPQFFPTYLSPLKTIHTLTLKSVLMKSIHAEVTVAKNGMIWWRWGSRDEGLPLIPRAFSTSAQGRNSGGGTQA